MGENVEQKNFNHGHFSSSDNKESTHINLSDPFEIVGNVLTSL